MSGNAEKWVAGVDGCKGGWVVALARAVEGRIAVDPKLLTVSCLSQVKEYCPQLAVLAVDIPIGLPSDKQERRCDKEARRYLNAGGSRRGSSVFPAPPACLLDPRTSDWAYETINRYFEARNERRLTRQTFAILPKIREAAGLLKELAGAGTTVIEVHPEVSFAAMAGKPVRSPKRRREGREERRDLLALEVRRECLPTARVGSASRQGVVSAAIDDQLDALAALWTAARYPGEVLHFPCDAGKNEPKIWF